jgi:hypothetical protein
MNLYDSLTNYNEYLYDLLKIPDVLERFKTLSNYVSLGCFCEPNLSCHVDIIRYYLKELNLNVPKRQCVKAKFLRKEINSKTGNKYDNLEEWCNNKENCLCTRNGRIFIGSKDNRKIFHYGLSEWSNPYKVNK